MDDGLGYRLGLPAWAFPGWRNRYFRSTPPALASYAEVFNTVEANTSFYRIPGESAVQSWREALGDKDFRLCFKLPRTVTHERAPSMQALRAFLNAIEPLAPHLGPLLLQFPATVGPAQLPALHSLLSQLPAGLGGVLEVRHPAFFDDPGLLEPLLRKTGYGRVVMDTRALYRGDRSHPDVQRALHEKPDLPVLADVHNGVAFVRLVLHPDLVSNQPWIDEWAAHVAGYIDAGVETFMMIHCPNNLHCPALAERFHAALRAQAQTPGLAPLPPWPVPQQNSLL